MISTIISSIVGLLLGAVVGCILTFFFLKSKIENNLLKKVNELPLSKMAERGFEVTMNVLDNKFGTKK